MSARPTLPTILTRVQDSIERKFPGSSVRKARGILPALANAQAGVAHELHGRIDQQATQMHPLNAKGDALMAWMESYGIRQMPGDRAQGSIDLIGADGSPVAAGEQLQIGTVKYKTVDETVIAAGVANIRVIALQPGIDGNQVAGTKLKFLRTVPGINATATVDESGLTGGIDADTEEQMQARFQYYLKNQHGIGTLPDYERWAFEAHPAVSNAWATKGELGTGWVTVRVMTYGATENGIPETGVIDAVLAYIIARCPAGAEDKVSVVSPIADPLDLVFSSLTPDTPATRAAVAAELADLMIREARPAGTLLLSDIQESIKLAAGVTDYQLASPSANVTAATGHIPVPGDITI